MLSQVEELKSLLIARSTGTNDLDAGERYIELRQQLREHSHLLRIIPDCVRQCGDLSQFWFFIRTEFDNYQDRRQYLHRMFQPSIDYLEGEVPDISSVSITESLKHLNAENVGVVWNKALQRRKDDPEGAITAARTLIETVCKHILDDSGVQYNPEADLPRLWYQTAELLNLAPAQHQEALFKSILGSTQQIVNNLGELRNKVGDAHGQGRRPVKPLPRHAELAVNLAGSIASFLVTTWIERPQPSSDETFQPRSG